MALTLPYPDLVFVPLDILTAEEQNEIVANYTYIANQFPIAASNIDFNMITAYNSNSGSQSVGANSTIALNNYTVKLGNNLSISSNGVLIGEGVSKILVSANIFYDSGTTSSYGWYSLTNNNQEILHSTTITSMAGGYGSSVCSPLIVSVSPGDIIRLRNISDGASIRNNSIWMTVIVVG